MGLGSACRPFKTHLLNCSSSAVSQVSKQWSLYHMVSSSSSHESPSPGLGWGGFVVYVYMCMCGGASPGDCKGPRCVFVYCRGPTENKWRLPSLPHPTPEPTTPHPYPPSSTLGHLAPSSSVSPRTAPHVQPRRSNVKGL